MTEPSPASATLGIRITEAGQFELVAPSDIKVGFMLLAAAHELLMRRLLPPPDPAPSIVRPSTLAVHQHVGA